PKASFVHLTVYNVIGQQVAELVNHEQSPGKYSVTFDGANVTSGIYFYRIEAGSFVQTNKMILLK
ncbi:MAG: T9SS type A sorting domain-containing protein, partial [Ignavibacteriaceae bacterium]